MTRAGMILLRKGTVALIERHRAGMHYFVFPGGQVEPGETLQETVVREAEEELGLKVTVGQLVAEITFLDQFQYYFLVESVGGNFGEGNGPELMGLYPPERGTYQPIWAPIFDLHLLDVRPKSLVDLVIAVNNGVNIALPVKIAEG